MDFLDTMTLKDAQDILRNLLDEGHKCPVCTQFAKVYKRKIHSSMARVLISMWVAGKRDWVYLPDLPQKSRDATGMAWWGLIEEEVKVRPDGGRAGSWRVTGVGEAYLFEIAPVRKYARIYDGRVLGFEGELLYIRQALGEKFDYDELMKGGEPVASQG